MKQAVIDSFEKFSKEFNGSINEQEKGYLTADKSIISVKLISNRTPIHYKFKERRSHTVSYHNEFNELTVKAALPDKSKLFFELKIKNNFLSKILNRSIKERIKTKTNNPNFAKKIVGKPFFLDFFQKYSFMNFKIESSAITLQCTYLDSIDYNFLKDIHNFLRNFT